MRAIANKLWTLLRALLVRRLRVPLTCLAVPVWTVLATLVVGFGGLNYTLHATSRPLFCLSCHEMGLPVETWRISSHKDVSCSDCHIMPGTINMFRSKASALRQVYLHVRGGVKPSAIQAHVPDANCKVCHPSTRDLIVYHDLQITHQAHWDRGIKCTVCHSELVHGPQAALKNTPRMETCYKCHDGKRAPNDCSTCHVVLGERRPTTFRPEWIEAHKENIRTERAESCMRCHRSDFCNNCHRASNPHPSTWMSQHPQGFRENPARCRVCHALPSETADMSFCRDCHALRRAHSLDWINVHPQKFRQSPKDCERCHQQRFCSDCHSIYRHHPRDWPLTHPAQARAKAKNCQVCHTPEYCQRCHEKAVPKSHSPQWRTRHGAAVSAGESDCGSCHRPNFCQACHASRAGKPASHGTQWRQRHGQTALVSTTACLTCHEKSYCTTCHGMSMPHPQGWPQAHRAAAKRDAKTCTRCHDQTFCVACHRSAPPSSHQKDWLERHGAQAKANPDTCKACHTDKLCSACHRGVKMPHAANWKVAHGDRAKSAAQRQPCAACHAPSYCSSCHGLDLPHPANWAAKHGAQGQQNPTACLRCHGPRAKGAAASKAACNSCHETLAPPSHEAKDWRSTDHVAAGSDKPDLCTLCHGANSCDTCHAKRSVGGAKAK